MKLYKDCPLKKIKNQLTLKILSINTLETLKI